MVRSKAAGRNTGAPPVKSMGRMPISHLMAGMAMRRRQRFMNATKRSAVSTGQLKAFLLLHLRPIHLLVLQGPSVNPEGDIET